MHALFNIHVPIRWPQASSEHISIKNVANVLPSLRPSLKFGIRPDN